MSKQSEMDDIEYESSVSSNLSFLNENEVQVSESQKQKAPKKSNNNSPQKTITSSKLKEPKDKSSKQESIEEEAEPEQPEKEKVSQPAQQAKPSESKVIEKQPQTEAIEAEPAKKKEESTEMEQEEEEQPVGEQDEAEEANGEDEPNNNNSKESEDEMDEEKEEDEQDDEEEGQETGNNQKEGKENENSTSAAQGTKKKGNQQSSSTIQKKSQQKGKSTANNSSNANQGSSKQNNNSNTTPSTKQNAKPTNPTAQSSKKEGSDTPQGSQTSKINQKRTLAQRQLSDEAATEVSKAVESKTQQATTNGNQTTTPAPQAQPATTANTSSQNVKPTKKLSSKFYLYKEGVKLPDLSEQLNQTIEVRVSKEYIHRFNKQYLSRSIWGSDNYTSDSDIVCILIHHGLVKFDSPEIQKDSRYAGVQVTFTVSKNRKTYASQEKNSITSRQNKTYSGFTIKPNQCNFITTLGSQEDLNKNAALMSTPVGRKKIKPNTVLQSRNILAIPEVNIVFNLSNDPAYKYSIVNFCDKGEESKDWMSHKLQTHALYIETDKERYEISRVPEGDMNLVNEFDAYKFSRVRDPNLVDNEEMLKLAIPLSPEKSEFLFTDLDWSDFKWGSNVVVIKDLEIKNLKCFKLYLKNQLD